jgi:hypothetical protein
MHDQNKKRILRITALCMFNDLTSLTLTLYILTLVYLVVAYAIEK